MAECPLPKPNTRVRFPSPAPKRNPHAIAWGFLFGTDDAFLNRARNALAANLQSKFAPRLQSKRGLVLIPVTAWGFLFGTDDAFQNRVRATRARGEFAKQICASIAKQERLGSDSRLLPLFSKTCSNRLHFTKMYAIIKTSLMFYYGGDNEKTFRKNKRH